MATINLEQTLTSFLPPNLSVDGLYSSLRHGCLQRPIAWSCKNMAIIPSWVPDRKVPSLMNPSLRFLSLLLTKEDQSRLWDTCIEDISNYHGQSNITHVLWNHAGNHFVSIDEKGKIVIWANKRYLNAWFPVYMVVLFNPVVCCEWINPDRTYVANTDGSTNTTKFERERTGRARGPLSLVVLSSDGQLTTLFKQAGQMFTHISTGIPRQSANEDITASRISHGSMMSGVDGIHLVTHSNSILPSTVNLYHIVLRFSPEQTFRCDALAVLHLSNPLTGPGTVMMPNVVQHLQLLPSTSTRPFAVAVALGSREETVSGEPTYQSQAVVWEVASKVMGFHPAFQELSTRRNEALSGQPSLTFVMLGERQFKDKFISTLSYVPRSREVLVGFSDGSLLGLESRFPGLTDSMPTLSDGFRRQQDGRPLVAVSASPNGFALTSLSLNGHISAAFTTEASGYDLEVDVLVRHAVVALLNEWDYSDIVSIVVKAARVSNDHQLPDQFIEGVFKCYDSINGAEDSSVLEPFLPRASVLHRMLSLQLVLFQALPRKLVQYRATSALLHLQSIGEVFLGCCTSDSATVAAHMEPGSNLAAGQKPLAFNTDALWSLFPLCGWVLDFCTILFRELAVFLNRKTKQGPTSSIAGGHSSPATSTSNPKTPTPVPSILCFLYHSRAKKSLRSVLILLEQFHAYVRVREQLYTNVVQTGGAIEAPPVVGQEKVNNHTNSMSIPEAVAMKDIHISTLSSHAEATFLRCPLKVGILKQMLRDLSGIGHHIDISRPNGINGGLHRAGDNGTLDKSASDHIVFIKGVVPSSSSASLAQAKKELMMIAKRHSSVWDMNRLMFSTIHWLDIEPAQTLNPPKSGSGDMVTAMNPMRCRIDPAQAQKPRVISAIHTSPNLGRQQPPLLQHHPSNVSTLSTGSRGSISGVSGRTGPVPMRVFTESPGELPMSHQANDSALRSMGHGFPDSSSAMITAGSTHHGHGTLLDAIPTPALGPRTIWGLTHDERDEDMSSNLNDSRAEELVDMKAIWNNWNLALQGQLRHQGSLKESQQESRHAEVVPDDDAMMEDDADEDEEEGDSDEEMREYKNPMSRSNGGNGSRRSSLAALAPSSLWLLQESNSISKRTRSEWTLLPILADEGSDLFAMHSGATSRWALQTTEGHRGVAPSSPIEHGEPSQAEIEAQVRKRRFGVDPIRKAKKYKSSGRSRQCIRCYQISTNTSANAKPSPRRPMGMGGAGANNNNNTVNNNIIPDIAASTLWYHNYDRSCICGGMWVEL
ncbi:MAG: hypothetical protein J3R72DRAFT_475070 [Linnemannia gamsii]|nr:MAG: hypothetical protein J3R72DRAFT_475070 [Linnemannia gamsii]